jgi:hypothetical protein
VLIRKNFSSGAETNWYNLIFLPSERRFAYLRVVLHRLACKCVV